MPKRRVRVAAVHDGHSVDVVKIERTPRTFEVFLRDGRGVHFTWRDGERAHTTAESNDLTDAGIDTWLVDAIQEATGNERNWAPGWESGLWADLDEVDRTYTCFVTADRLRTFLPARGNDPRLTWHLGDTDGVEAAHYLARPGAEAEALLAKLEAHQDIHHLIIDDWEPWSIVTATLRRRAIAYADD